MSSSVRSRFLSSTTVSYTSLEFFKARSERIAGKMYAAAKRSSLISLLADRNQIQMWEPLRT